MRLHTFEHKDYMIFASITTNPIKRSLPKTQMSPVNEYTPDAIEAKHTVPKQSKLRSSETSFGTSNDYRLSLWMLQPPLLSKRGFKDLSRARESTKD